MDWGKLTEDQLDELIVRAEGEIASWRAVQMAAVGEKRSRGSHRADGHRSIVEWVAARADVSQETARRICWTGSRLGDAPETAELLAAGEVSFDRAERWLGSRWSNGAGMRVTTSPNCVVWSPIIVA